MKRTILTAVIYPLMLLAVLAGCNNPSNNTKSAPPSNSGGNDAGGKNDATAAVMALLNAVTEKDMDDLPDAQQAEIEKLYGCYWAEDGSKNECLKIGNKELTVYSVTMGGSFTNIRWGKTGSTWICVSYGADEESYSPEDRRIIFIFKPDESGTVKLIQHIKLMDATFGPYKKGKPIEKFQKDGTTLYAYDTDSPKMKEPDLK